jgi:hypothetical protein
MAETNPTDCERDPAHPSADDVKTERVVLAFLLEEHPSLLTIPELSRALNADPGFDTDDAVERAIRELVGGGLLHCEGAFIVPTRAALYFAQLETD